MSQSPVSSRSSPLFTQNAFDEVCHPDAPRGGGGFGYFRQAGVLGTEGYQSLRYLHPQAPASHSMSTPPVILPAAGAAIDITALPRIMDANAWPKGAALMRSWFARDAHTVPDRDTPDASTITMAWVLGFARAKSVYDSIMKDKIWQNEAAKAEVAVMLRRKGLLKKGQSYRAEFGDFSQPVPTLHAEHVNFRTVGMSSVALDDMDAALGRFAFHVLVQGTVQGDLKGAQVTIQSVAVYVKDSYDFEGSQSLGYWDPQDNSASAFNRFSGTKVTNSDFRRWRSTNGKGGDFLVFSDLKVQKLTEPDRFSLAP